MTPGKAERDATPLGTGAAPVDLLRQQLAAILHTVERLVALGAALPVRLALGAPIDDDGRYVAMRVAPVSAPDDADFSGGVTPAPPAHFRAFLEAGGMQRTLRVNCPAATAAAAVAAVKAHPDVERFFGDWLFSQRTLGGTPDVGFALGAAAGHGLDAGLSEPVFLELASLAYQHVAARNGRDGGAAR